MLNVSRPLCVCAVLLGLLATLAGTSAQGQTESTIPTPLQKQLDRLDLGVSGIGVFNRPSSGTIVRNNQPNGPTSLSIDPGNTLGALVTVRYVVKPLVGFEVNYRYSRYTQKFTGVSNTPGVLGIQNNASGITVGYVAHTPQLFGVNPFIGVGAGTTVFRPTPTGGLGYLEQARATYYYSLGAETTLGSPHFGLRAQFRQEFFLAPDYGTNYLTIKQHTTTFEPGIGFFLRF
jgi:hypothetical protein